mgnify:CR=1 FL=1
MTELRGPVHLDISATVAGRPAVPLATSCRPDPPPYPDREALDRAARAISDASRPLLLAGSHCRSSDAAQWLRAFVEALPAPLLTTVRAKGALPDPHPLMLGVLGVSGVEARLLGRADLVIAIGLDALELVPEPCWSSAPVIVFGPAAMPDGRVPAVQVLGEVGAIVEELALRLRDKARADWDVAEVDRVRRGCGTERRRRTGRARSAPRARGDTGRHDRDGRRGRTLRRRGHVLARDRPAGIPSWPRAVSALRAGFCAARQDRRPTSSIRIAGSFCFTEANEPGRPGARLETAARIGARCRDRRRLGARRAGRVSGDAAGRELRNVRVRRRQLEARFAPESFSRALAAERHVADRRAIVRTSPPT